MTATTVGPRTIDPTIASWLRRGLLTVTLLALVLVVFDAGGPLRQVAALLAVLVAPGLAASLRMGPMSVELRALISLTVSTALLTVIATGMALFEWWSPTTAFVIVAAFVAMLALLPSESGRNRTVPTREVRIDIPPRSGEQDEERGGDDDGSD